MKLPEDFVNQCGCELCRMEVNSPESDQHRRINLLMSRLDEQQRRWFAGYLAKAYGNLAFVALVTGCISVWILLANSTLGGKEGNKGSDASLGDRLAAEPGKNTTEIECSSRE